MSSSDELESNFSEQLDKETGSPVISEDTMDDIIDALTEEEIEEASEEAPEAIPDEIETSATDIILELGDRIIINSTQYGQLTGRIYYRDNDLIRILPDGISNRVYDFDLTDGEFDDSLGIEEVGLLEKRITPSFVQQNNLQAGQILSTFSANGDAAEEFTIVKANQTTDYIRIRNSDGDERNIYFNYIGIPRDQPFNVVLGREGPKPIEEKRTEIQNKIPEVPEFEEEGVPTEKEIEESRNQAPHLTQEIDTEIDIDIIGFIDIPAVLEVANIPQSQRMFPEEMQKSDALNDFLHTLDAAQQKDPIAIRRIRILIELLSFLKNEVVHYDETGAPHMKMTSVDTLRDMLHSVTVPLGRPVLDVKKRVYYAPAIKTEGRRKPKKTIAAEAEEEDAAEINMLTEEQQKYLYQIPFFDELSEFIESNKGSAGVGGKYDANFWIWLPNMLRRFSSTWLPEENNTVDKWSAIGDSEFFRTEVPVSSKEDAVIAGSIPSGDGTAPIFIDKVSFGYERALGPQFRPDEKRRHKLLMESEGAPLKAYLIFPLKEEAAIGATRTGSLAKDIEASQAEPKWMGRIIRENPIDETPTSTGILAMGSNGNTVGNIALADYFDALQLPVTSMNGIGDLVAALHPFGIENLELSTDVFRILKKKIDAYQASLKHYIQGLRQELQSIVAAAAPAGILTGDAAAAQQEKLQAQPVLKETLAELQRHSPTIATMDIAQIAHLLNTYPDLTIATLGSVPTIMKRAQLRAARDDFIEALHIAKQLQKIDANRGAGPTINPCHHVKMMKDIKRLSNETDRFTFMIKLLNKYQGDRKDNWITCSSCNDNLICLHEFIQLQQFMKPREKQTLQKELVLQFSGPIFSGKYICRNCGQPFADLDFDTHIEFDDEGRPLMGRAELVDKDAIEEEAINAVLTSPTNDIEESLGDLLRNPKQKIIYFIAKEIADRVGINLDTKSAAIIIKRTMKYVNTLISEEEYIQATRRKDYVMYTARSTVIAAAIHLLIQIQTRIPNFTVRYTLHGCSPAGFDGYPMNDDRTGVNYIACAIASIQRISEPPWSLTGFFAEKQDAARQKLIIKSMESIMKNIVNDIDIQIAITNKKKYLEETLGGSRGGESIPARFLPAIHKDTETIIENTSVVNQTELWMRTADKYAEKNANIILGSPFPDTTCCISKVTEPGAFWKDQANIPVLDKREIKPKSYIKLAPYFTPRPLAELLSDAPEAIYYRVFLKLCFRGPRIGHSHEIGKNLKCPWCDFVFPFHPNMMQGASAAEKEDMERQLELSLRTQNVMITSETFQELLDATHAANKIAEYQPPKIMSGKFIGLLYDMDTPPIADITEWRQIIESLKTAVDALPPNYSEIDAALAVKDITGIIDKYEASLKSKMKTAYTIYETIIKLGADNYSEVILTYFIQPISRLLNNFNTDSIIFVQNNYKLSEDHVKTIKENILAPDVNIVNKYYKTVHDDSSAFIRIKLDYFKKQFAAVRRIFAASIEKGGIQEYLQQIMKRMLFIAPVIELLDANIVPPTEERASIAINTNLRMIYDLLTDSFKKYNSQKLGYSMEAIKEELMVRSEKEKTNFIQLFDRMTEDEKSAEKTMKMLGIGKWAVGGTSAIRIYDADRWDAERAERAAAGIMDFTDAPPEGREYDEMGIPDYGGAEDGYDNTQVYEDDY
jgi:hypothetical protein